MPPSVPGSCNLRWFVTSPEYWILQDERGCRSAAENFLDFERVVMCRAGHRDIRGRPAGRRRADRQTDGAEREKGHPVVFRSPLGRIWGDRASSTEVSTLPRIATVTSSLTRDMRPIGISAAHLFIGVHGKRASHEQRGKSPDRRVNLLETRLGVSKPWLRYRFMLIRRPVTARTGCHTGRPIHWTARLPMSSCMFSSP